MPVTPNPTHLDKLDRVCREASFSANSNQLARARAALDRLAISAMGDECTGVIGVEISVDRGQFGDIRPYSDRGEQ